MRRPVLLSLCVPVLVCASVTASAQPFRSGPTFIVGNATTAITGVDVAHDFRNDRWLQVSARGHVEGHLLDSSGTLIGEFRINSGSGAARNPRLAYSPHVDGGAGGYLVAWHATEGAGAQLHGRMVRADGVPLGADFVIGSASLWSVLPAVEYSAGSGVFLVTWAGASGTTVHARRVSLSGTLLTVGGSSDSWTAPHAGTRPDLAYSTRRDRFYLVYEAISSGCNCAVSIGSVFIDAATGETQTISPAFGIGPSALTTAKTTYDSSAGQYLVTWVQERLVGQLVNEDGAASSTARTLSTTHVLTYDIDFNAQSGEYLAVYDLAPSMLAVGIRSDGTAYGGGAWFQLMQEGFASGCDPRTTAFSGGRVAASRLEKRWLAGAQHRCSGQPEPARAVAQFAASTATAEAPDGGASLLNYTPGATLDGPVHTFRWSPGSRASAYWINVGPVQGRYEYYSNYVGAQTSLTLNNLPLDGSPVWLRLMSYIDGAYRVQRDYRFTAAVARAAEVTSPAPGSTLPGTTATFEWDAGERVDGFWVNVGTVRGGYTIYSNFTGKSRRLTLSGLPLDGRSVWVRLGSLINGQYVWRDAEFRAASPRSARITAPTPGAQFTGTAQAFHWEAGLGATAYWLDVGSVQGGAEYWSNYHGQDLMAIVRAIPANERPVWVRLWSRINGVWTFTDQQYTAAKPAAAQLTSHHAGSTLTSTSPLFTWSAGVGATAYWLDIGSVRGGAEYYSNYQGTFQSRRVSGLPSNGGQLWLRLWSYINGAWTFVDYPLTAYRQP